MSEVTAVVLAFNEAELLPFTLPPIKAANDRVVIVDMGSTDGSLDIYKSVLTSDDLVLTYPQENLHKFGFSHPRNYGASHAKTEWIFAVDCDEFLIADDFLRLRHKLKTTSSSVFSIGRLNYAKSDSLELPNISGILDNPPPTSEGHRRLYRNRPRIRYEGLIHEELWIGDLNAFDNCDTWAAPLHHLNQYKTQGSAHHKFGLYSYLTLQAVEFPSRRFGTNDFWFTTYVQLHLSEMLNAARDYVANTGATPLNENLITAQLITEGTLTS